MIKNDQEFICENCGKHVAPLKYTSRNHCPYCLYSLHVDNIPGDRQNPCRAKMKPISIEPNNKKGYIITYKCTKCGEVKRNKSADDDDFDLMLKIIEENAKYSR